MCCHLGHRLPEDLLSSSLVLTPGPFSDPINPNCFSDPSYGGLSHRCLRASFSLEPPFLICRHLQGVSIYMSCLCLRFLSHPECHSILPKLASPDRSILGCPNISPSSRSGSVPAILSPWPPLLAQPSLSRSWPCYLAV